MKKILLLFALASVLCSCDGRSKAEKQAYVDSLFHVLSCSPTIVAGPYTLEDQLNACDLLMKEYPQLKKDWEKVRADILKKIEMEEAERY